MFKANGSVSCSPSAYPGMGLGSGMTGKLGRAWVVHGWLVMWWWKGLMMCYTNWMLGGGGRLVRFHLGIGEIPGLVMR